MKRYAICGTCENGLVWLHLGLLPRVIGNPNDGFYDMGRPALSMLWWEDWIQSRMFYSWKIAENMRDLAEGHLRKLGLNRVVFKLKTVDVEFPDNPRILRRSLRMESKQVGSKEDPYYRASYTLSTNSTFVTFVSCALAGLWVEKDGKRVTDPAPANGELDKEHDDGVRETFEYLSGVSFGRFMRCYDRIYVPDPMGHPSEYV